MVIAGKEYKERETELTADEYLRCGVVNEKYSTVFKKYIDIDTEEKELPKLWKSYQSLWLQRIAFFVQGDISGLALDKLTLEERQVVDDFFTSKLLPYMKRLVAYRQSSSNTESEAQADS